MCKCETKETIALFATRVNLSYNMQKEYTFVYYMIG